jgi:hypothetical protein
MATAARAIVALAPPPRSLKPHHEQLNANTTSKPNAFRHHST